MLVGKLYVVPFTKKYIAAVDMDDAEATARGHVKFLSDLYTEDLVSVHGHISLSKPYLGEKRLICTEGVIRTWQGST